MERWAALRLKYLVTAGLLLLAGPAPASAQETAPAVPAVSGRDLSDVFKQDVLGQTRTELAGRFGTQSLDRQQRADTPAGSVFLEAIANAVRRHPAVRASTFGKAEADENITAARAGLLPQIAVGFDTRTRLSNRTSEDREADRQTTSGISALVSVSQLVFDAGATFDRIDAAAERSLASEANVGGTAQNYAIRAVSAYLDVARYTAQVQLAEDNLRRHESIHRFVAERVEAGAASGADQARAAGRLATARSGAASLRGILERANASYREVFKSDPKSRPSEEISSDALPDIAPPLPETPDEAVLLAIDANPQFRGQQALTRAAQYDFFAERATLFPKVAVEVSGTQFNVMNRADTRLYDLTARLQVSYSLFNGFSDAARRRAAQQRFSQARFDEETTRLALERDVRFAFSEVTARAERLRALELGVKADESTMEAYVEQFTIGRRSLMDLLDAQRDQFNSLVGMIDSRVDVEIARYQLLAYTGGLLPFLGITDLEAGMGEP